MAHAVRAVGQVGAGQDFRVGARLKDVADAFELAAELQVIVDFAVLNDGDRPDRHRLAAAFGIDDGQPLVGESAGPFDENSLAVRPAVDDRLGHGRQQRGVDGCLVFVEHGHEAAHVTAPFDRRTGFG